MCFQNGYPDRPEDEREGDWRDPSELTDGDMPWAPNPVDKPEPWKRDGWRTHPMGPEERFYREMLEAEDEDDGA